MAPAHRPTSVIGHFSRLVGVALIAALVLTSVAACGGKSKKKKTKSGSNPGVSAGKSGGGSGSSGGSATTYAPTTPTSAPVVPKPGALSAVLVQPMDLPGSPSVSVANEVESRAVLSDKPECQPLLDLVALKGTVTPTGAAVSAWVDGVPTTTPSTFIRLGTFRAGDAKRHWDQAKSVLDKCTAFPGTNLGDRKAQFTVAKAQSPSYGDESFAFTLGEAGAAPGGPLVVVRVGDTIARFGSENTQLPNATVVTKQIDKLRTFK